MGKALTEQQLIDNKSFTKDEVEEFRRVFSLFDKDGDGSVTAQELGAVMKRLGQDPSEAELQDIVNEGDTDANGSMDFPEFLSLMASKSKNSDPDAELRAAFEVFDRNGDGVISASELREVMNSIGENLSDSELEQLIKEVDKDGNGTIDFDEFVEVLNRMS